MGRVIGEVDGNGGVTAHGYDAFGNETSTTRYATFLDKADQAAGVSTSLSSLEASLTATAPGTAAANTAVTAAYAKMDAELAVVTAGAGRSISTAFDALDRKVLVTQPQVDYYLQFSGYGAQDNIQDGLPRISPSTSYRYDAFGDLIAQSTLIKPQPQNTSPDPLAYPNSWATTYYGYDGQGNQTDILDALGYYTRNTYDAFGRLADHIEYAQPQTVTVTAGVAAFQALTPVRLLASAGSASGYDRETQYQYDRLDRQITQVKIGVQYSQLNGSSVSGQIGSLTTSTKYDAVGNVIQSTDETGAATKYVYDSLGHMVAMSSPSRTSLSANSSISMRSVGLQYVRGDYFDDPISTDPGQLQGGGGYQSLDMQWSSLANWGTGGVVVTVQFDKKSWLRGDSAYNEADVTQVLSLTAAEGDSGASIDLPAIDGHRSYIRGVNHITVQKYVGGSLVTVYDSSQPSSMTEIGGAVGGLLVLWLRR